MASKTMVGKMKSSRKNSKPWGDYHHYPICPHCEKDDCDWWDGTNLQTDGDTQISICGYCNEKYDTLMHVSYNFQTRKID